MAFNARSDVFHTGAAEGGPVRLLDPAQIAALPSGDFPGKKVGQIAHRKRGKPSYNKIKQKVRDGDTTPATLLDGVLIDGHTRAAAHLSLRKPMAVRESAAR